MSLALLFHCLLLNMFRNVSTSIFRSLRLIVDLSHGLYCSGSMCVGVTVWFGWGGVVSLCRLKQCFSLHKDKDQDGLSLFNYQDEARSNKHKIKERSLFWEISCHSGNKEIPIIFLSGLLPLFVIQLNVLVRPTSHLFRAYYTTHSSYSSWIVVH